MRVKLIVVHSERGGEPRSYVLDQDAIVIGRAGTCDLPLDDPDRVVSKQHAELRVEGDALRAVDLGSKNHTFVDGERVGMNGLPVRDGAVLTMGPFQVTVQIERDVMVADDLDRTVFGAAFNPVGEEAEALASALGDLRRAFGGLAQPDRADALRMALRGALGPGPDADVLAALVAPGDPLAPAVPEPSPAMTQRRATCHNTYATRSYGVQTSCTRIPPPASPSVAAPVGSTRAIAVRWTRP